MPVFCVTHRARKKKLSAWKIGRHELNLSRPDECYQWFSWCKLGLTHGNQYLPQDWVFLKVINVFYSANLTWFTIVSEKEQKATRNLVFKLELKLGFKFGIWVGMIRDRIDNLIWEKTHKGDLHRVNKDMLRKEYIQQTWKGTKYMRFMLREKWS